MYNIQISEFLQRKDGREQTMKMSVGGKIAFGIGAFGKDMVYSLSAYYLMYYYQDILKLSPSFVGTVLMVARIFDALNDPVMGALVARTRSRWGRFRPWLFSGTILNAFVLYALFAAPVTTETWIMVWFTVAYLLWGITYTMLDIPYWSMIPAAAETTADREHLAVIGRTCAGVGGALITVFSMVAVSTLGQGNEREGFRLMALIVAVAFVAAEILCCVMIRERKRGDTKATRVRDMFRELIRNDQAVTVAVAIVLINVSTFLTTNMIIYFFKYDYGGADWQTCYTIFIGVGSSALVLGMMLLYPLLRRKKVANEKIFTFAIQFAILGYAMMLTLCLTGASGKLVLMCIPGVLVFVCNGMLTVLTTVFLANSVDYGELMTHHRDESVTFSMQTFVVKAASGLAVFITGIGLDIIGLTGNAEETGEIIPQSASTLTGLRIMMNVLPMIGLILALLYFRKKFKLTDKRMAEITEQLKSTSGT